ncbi:MAG: hypothetical protein PHX82_10175, partial [Paracoccaceae bacterium]|nr:hypothetical protein [Paracoccaceae bacterium]
MTALIRCPIWNNRWLPLRSKRPWRQAIGAEILRSALGTRPLRCAVFAAARRIFSSPVDPIGGRMQALRKHVF